MTFNQEIRATAELCGTVLSEFACELLAEELANYDQADIRKALLRCRRELKGRLTTAEVLSRIDDGRPTADEAFAKLPWDEEHTALWTDEMRQAMGVAQPAWDMGDKQGARLAFREAYNRLVSERRASNVPVNWSATYGTRERPFQDRQERDSHYESKQAIRDDADALALSLSSGPNYKQIEKPKDAERTPIPEEVKALVRKALKGKSIP